MPLLILYFLYDSVINLQKTKNIGEKEERLSLNSSPVSEHREVGTEQYPENGNIVEMDYSPARRKPPIHN